MALNSIENALNLLDYEARGSDVSWRQSLAVFIDGACCVRWRCLLMTDLWLKKKLIASQGLLTLERMWMRLRHSSAERVFLVDIVIVKFEALCLERWDLWKICSILQVFEKYAYLLKRDQNAPNFWVPQTAQFFLFPLDFQAYQVDIFFVNNMQILLSHVIILIELIELSTWMT